MKFTAGALLLLFLQADLNPGAVLQSPRTPRESFAMGYAQFSTGKYAQAKEFFQKALDPNYALADYSLYYLALIASQEANWEASRQLSLQLRQQYPPSVWFHSAQLQRAKSYIAERNYPQALESLQSLRTEKELVNLISEEALYLQAQTLEAQGNFSQAFALYLELRQFAPNSHWGSAARREMGRLRDRYPDLFGLHSINAISEEADLLVKERQYKEAESLYQKLLNQELGPSLRLRVLAKLADVYLSVRKRNEAIPLLEEIARDFQGTHEAANALYRIGQILWNRNDNGQALEYFKKLMERYPGGPHADRAFFAVADIYESQRNHDKAIALYNTIPKRFPHSQVRDDATWRLGWLYYGAGQFRKAAAAFRSLGARTKDERFQAASLYWQARSLEPLGETETAVRVYHKIYNAFPESYYQPLAIQRLARLGIVVAEAEIRSDTVADGLDAEIPVNTEMAFHLVRAKELAALNLNPLAVIELAHASRFAGRQPEPRRLLMREYALNRAYSYSVAIANQLPQGSAERDRYRFPLAYWEAVQEKARERGLDPFLVLALIRQESLFDTRARSPAAALGLMQLIPSTATRVAKQTGLPAPAHEKLFEPDVNLTLGAQYLKSLLDRYSNNWHKALAAYNAGESAVDRWEKEIATEDMEEFVERIPYFETRQYVKLVLRNHRVYKRLYDQQK
jgi:soluble lytic murein transglycosylase